MRIKDRRLSFPQSWAADIVRRTAAHRPWKQGEAKDNRCREAHLQHQEEDQCDKCRDDHTDSQATRIYTQLIVTNVGVSKPSSRSTIWFVTIAKGEVIRRNARACLIPQIHQSYHIERITRASHTIPAPLASQKHGKLILKLLNGVNRA